MTKPPPYAHQSEALTLLTGRAGFMLALDAGTGKSRIMIDDMLRIARLNRTQRRPMPAFWIVAPSGVHDETWPHELHTWWEPDVPLSFVVYHSGQGKKKTAERIALGKTSRLDTVVVLVQHYESLSAKSGTQAAEMFLHASRTRGRLVGAYLDEIHYVKTPKAIRTKTITRLIHTYTRVRRGASGTLVGKGHEDLFAPYRLLQPTIMPPTFTAFKAAYCIEKSMGGRYTKIVGYRDAQGLYDRVSPITMRVTRDMCLTLPDRQLIDRMLQPTPEQDRIMAELKSLTMAELDNGIITATEAGTRLLRFAQLSGGFIQRDDDETGVVTPVPTRKTAALADILQSYGDAKVLVWGRFRPDIDQILAVCAETGTSAIRHDGSMKREERDAALSLWRTPNGPRVLAATMTTLGIGRTLNEATLAVFYSLTFDRVIFEQTLARNYRAGQQEKTVVILSLIHI